MPFDRALLVPIKSGFDRDLLEPIGEEGAEVALPGEIEAIEAETSGPSIGPARPQTPWQAFRTSTTGRKLLGPTPVELEAMGGKPGSQAGLLQIPEAMLQMTSVPPQAAKPIRAVTDPLIEALPETAGGIARGVRETGLQLPLAPIPAGAGKAVLPFFAGQYLAGQGPSRKAFREALARGDKREAVALATEEVLGGALLGLGGLHEATKGKPDASKIKEAAAVHGDMQPFAREGAGEMPVKESGAGVQPQAEAGVLPSREALTQANRFEATTPHENLAAKMASQVGKTVEFTDDLPQAVIARPGPKDTIHIDRNEFAKWMEGRSPEEAPLLIESIIDEEEIHSHTPDEIGKNYHDAKTPLQRKMALRRYAGKGGPEVSPTNLGKEMLRFDLTRLMGKTPREILEAKGSEWLTVKFITAAERVIDSARKALGTEASKNQARILGEMEQKVGLARQALGVGPRSTEADTSDEGELAATTENAPFALRKGAQERLPEEFKDKPVVENVQAALNIMPDKLKEYPGGTTAFFHDLGSMAKTPEDVAALKSMAESAKQRFGQFKAAGDWDSAMAEAGMQRAEAYEYATGVTLDGKPKWITFEKFNPDYEPSVPDASYVAAKQPPMEAQFGEGGPVIKGATPPPLSKEALARLQRRVTWAKEEGLLGEEPPAARRKLTQDERQQEMPLAAGVKGERPSAEELGATAEAVTPAKLEALTQEHLQRRQARPSFTSFATEVKERFGNVQPGQLKEAWRDNVWKSLIRAGGNELARLRDQLGLKESLGGGEFADPVEERFTLKQEGSAAGRRAMREDVAAIRDKQNRRNEAVARIGEKLIKHSETERPSLRRSSVKPEDIGWWRETGGIEPPFVEFKPAEKVSPEKLTSGATVDTARKLPSSASTRLVALRDNLSGKTELVSAYKDHGKHYAVDPGNPGAARPHVLINDLLQRKLSNGKPRYSPVASLLLDEPVQRFHQRMDSHAWREFADAAGNEAQRRKESAAEAAALPQPETQEARPALRTGTAITDAEAGAILDHLHDEIGKLDSPEDMRDALTALQERANAGTLKGRDWQVISGLEKSVEKIQKQFPNVGPNEAYEKALDQIYSHAIEAPSREAFVQRMLGRPAADVAQGISTGEGESQPAAYRKSTGRDIGAEFTKAGTGLRALWRRSPINVNIAAHLDSFINRGNNTARKAGNSIRIQSSDPKARTSLERGAAIRVVEARDKEALLGFANNVGTALQRARELAKNGKSILDRYEGRKWEKAALRMQDEVMYAYDNWTKLSLQRTAAKGRAVLDEVYELDKKRGVKLDYRGGYIPGRYEGEIFNDNILTFGDQQLILGRNWRKAKAFSNYSEAIKEGYIPVNSDLADLAEHRVRQSWREGGKDLWLDSLKQWNDPDSGEAIVKELAKQEVPRPMKKVTDDYGQTAMVESAPKVEWGTPSPDYVKFSLGPGKDVVAVRRGYEKLLQTLTMQGHISMHPVGDVALHVTGALKHGVILILDTFHPGRLGQYAFGISNKPGYRKGFHVLEYAEEDMQRAADKGLIPQSSVDWAKGTIDVRLPGGRTAPMTRRAVIDFGEGLGLNTGRIQDALYKETVRRWPLIGALNRFTFDRLTRGLMAEGVVSEFERLNKAFPLLDRNAVMTKVVRDINRYYGNLGNQGVFRNPTIKEINQLIFLAPQWVEGLLQKEIRGAARAVTGPYDVVRNKFVQDAEKRIPFGTIGRGMGRGLAAYFILTQVVNLITRRQSTFQNAEPDHKLDAWIPGGKNGFFISPLSVFAEVAHDILRYAEQKPMLNEALTQIGYNKLGPWGRLAVVLGTERNGQGEKLTSTPSVYREAAMQVVPFAGASPISVSKLAREAGHAIAPSLVAPNQPGAVQRQLMSSAGIKVEPAKSPPASIADKARRFAEAQHWKKRDFPEATEDPSYNKVRQAIRIGDEKAAMKLIAELRKETSDAQIVKAMRQHISRPFTGSEAHEGMFKKSLSAADAALFDAARDEQKQELEKFLALWDKRP